LPLLAWPGHGSGYLAGAVVPEALKYSRCQQRALQCVAQHSLSS